MLLHSGGLAFSLWKCSDFVAALALLSNIRALFQCIPLCWTFLLGGCVSIMLCFPLVALAVTCLALRGPLCCPFFPQRLLWQAHSCIPKSSACSKMPTSRSRKRLPETTVLSWSTLVVFCPPLPLCWKLPCPEERLASHPDRPTSSCPAVLGQPPGGPPAPRNLPACALPSQQPRQAGDALTGSRWSPAEVSGAQQWNHIDHIAPFLFFSFNFSLEVLLLITSPSPLPTFPAAIAACLNLPTSSSSVRRPQPAVRVKQCLWFASLGASTSHFTLSSRHFNTAPWTSISPSPSAQGLRRWGGPFSSHLDTSKAWQSSPAHWAPWVLFVLPLNLACVYAHKERVWGKGKFIPTSSEGTAKGPTLTLFPCMSVLSSTFLWTEHLQSAQTQV